MVALPPCTGAMHYNLVASTSRGKLQTQASRGAQGGTCCYRGVAPAGSLQGVVRVRLAPRPSSQSQVQPTEAALEIAGLIRCVTLIQHAVRQYQAVRRSRAATVVSSSLSTVLTTTPSSVFLRTKSSQVATLETLQRGAST